MRDTRMAFNWPARQQFSLAGQLRARQKITKPTKKETAAPVVGWPIEDCTGMPRVDAKGSRGQPKASLREKKVSSKIEAVALSAGGIGECRGRFQRARNWLAAAGWVEPEYAREPAAVGLQVEPADSV